MIKSIQIAGNARYGGATYLMLEWCRYLLNKGCRVDALCTDAVMLKELRKIPEIRVVESIYIPREIRPITDLIAFKKTFELFCREQYDVVHTYTATPSFIGRMAARMARVPVIVNHQGGWAVNPTSSLPQRIFYTPLEYLGALASTKTICVSHAEARLAKQLNTAPRYKLVTISNGIKPERFVRAAKNNSRQKMRQELGFSDSQILIGTTSRLVPGKGNEILIKALTHLKEINQKDPVTLLFAGDGIDRRKLENLANSLGLADQVRFLGFVEDIASFLAAVDYFAIATLTEGMSISLLEAMASAKPVVATSIPPNQELIHNKTTGLLVPVNSPTAMANAITRFMKNPVLAARCAMAAQQRVKNYYTLERMFDETWKLYVRLLNNKIPESVLKHRIQTSFRKTAT